MRLHFLSPRKLILALLLALSLGAWIGGAALAQEPTPSDDDVNRVARDLYCPVCENTPLDVCPTQACAQWREVIREKLAQGWTDEQIKTYFVEMYGERVLAAPRARGINWLIYVVPPLGILAGVYLVWRTLRKCSPAAQPPAVPPAPLEPADDEYVRRLEEELRKH